MMMGNGVVHGDFDQEKWVDRHRRNVNSDDPTAVLRYVRWRHPLLGLAKPVSLLPKWRGTEKVEQMSAYADATTMLCLNKIGQDEQTKWPNLTVEQLRSCSTTDVANVAFIALYHNDRNIRSKGLQQIELWRAASSHRLVCP
jgi:hypothetical protein